ncbi:helix-turn-helix domain-containing protein [Desulfogranum japonicum]|uniref:helix-turn-helix domain-containing protein n=1 Tax=Desulfogranum japonicum TaxID=231447 RepID=UPI0003FEF6FB|nr:helix-turn-helix domain-containing protein [Desulfogranum japonicum]
MSLSPAENHELYMVEQFAQFTDQHIFLTGRAGTGKTTFLHNLKKQTDKRLIITAPTGVAAINAGGVTLHSFFQLPFGPCIPDSNTQTYQHRFSKEKRNIIKNLDLLVIDEISMVRADVLDGVDRVLRRYRRNETPFGGVQLLMIGDLHQLSPVVKDSEKGILEQYYQTPFFFSSLALQKTHVIPIELLRIYRQSDNHFIDLLNRIRDNNLDAASLEALNTRYDAHFTAEENAGYIYLCTHNNSARSINTDRLKELPGKSYYFDAEVDGQFPEHTYPTPGSLELKLGAQVMFIRNDNSPEKRYFNGKIGKVTGINSKTIEVTCKDHPYPIEVESSQWDNIDYKMDEEQGEIQQKVIGTFKQYPLKLAWAITVHKSQGLTFDKAIIDLQSAFAHGQVYVALSRCRSLEGIVLSSPLTASGLHSDRTIQRFLSENQKKKPDLAALQRAKIEYQQRLLLSCFTFLSLQSRLGSLMTLILRNAAVVSFQGAEEIQPLFSSVQKDICTVGENFKRQLNGLFQQDMLPGDDPVIQERLTKASAYFSERFQTGLLPFLSAFQFDTDSKEIRKNLKNAVETLEEETAIKLAAVRSCKNGFIPSKYLRAISTACPEKKKTPVTSDSDFHEEDVKHTDLLQQLKKWRTQKAQEKNVPPYQILHLKVLVQVAIFLPGNEQELKRIKGIGKRLCERYGQELLSMVAEYRKSHDIQDEESTPSDSAQPGEPSPAQQKQGNTRDITLELFRQGLTMEQIAEKRGLVPNTIAGHLAFEVEKGEVSINDLIPDSKRDYLEQFLENLQEKELGEIKELAGEDYSYGEIKLMLAHLKFQKIKGNTA